MKKIFTLTLLMTSLFSFGQNNFASWNLLSRIGGAYNSFEPFGNANFDKFSKERWIQPSVRPVIGVSIINDSIGKRSNGTFIRIELSLTQNKSEYSTFSPNVPFKQSIHGVASLYYSSLSFQYGLKLGKKITLGPTIGFESLVGNQISKSDIAALDSFGIYDSNKAKLNSSIKKININLGICLAYNITKNILVQANINYGILPQIKIEQLPVNYQNNAQLSIGYLFKNKHKSKVS